MDDQRLKPLREAIAEDCMASREAAAWNARSKPLDQDLSAALARVAASRRFPDNTDAASRHVELIAETAPEHKALSMLSVVASLYDARNATAGLFEALDACEAAMSIVEPRSNKAQYLEVLAQARAALKKAKRDA